MSDLPVLVRKMERGVKNPARVYLAGASQSGRRTVDAQLRGVAKMVGARSIDEMPWNMLKHEHVVALKTKALEVGKSPATVNLMLAGIRGAVRTAWNMGLLSAEELARIESVKGVKAHITIKSGKGRKDRILFLNNGGADAVKDYILVRGSSAGFLFWASLKSGSLIENSSMTDQAVC